MYACAPGSAPQLVVTWNTVLEVAPGDLRVVKPHIFSIYDATSNINALDQITFHVEFTDGSFAAMFAKVASTTRDSLKTGEATAIKGISGDASVQSVVRAMMTAEQHLRAAIAVRDRVVAAYQEISRMQI